MEASSRADIHSSAPLTRVAKSRMQIALVNLRKTNKAKSKREKKIDGESLEISKSMSDGRYSLFIIYIVQVKQCDVEFLLLMLLLFV